jgi:hypothetical protein
VSFIVGMTSSLRFAQLSHAMMPTSGRPRFMAGLSLLYGDLDYPAPGLC